MRILVTIATHCAVCVAAALLAACGGGSGGRLNPSPGGVTAERTHVRPAYSVLYSFEGGSGDGEFPFAGLLNVKGTLYGTTYFGGATEGGTVFEITPSGTETVLYSFKGGSSGDGTLPEAGLIDADGTLYGTTSVGGAHDLGTVYATTRSGYETRAS
ncbi:MAG: choice-of-anchor tandem repeat GloVer-containing protein [Candidatus Cybelea sp.]